jgi:hypothetical protein
LHRPPPLSLPSPSPPPSLSTPRYEVDFVNYTAQWWPVRLYFADDKQAVAEEPLEPPLRDRYGSKDEVAALGDAVAALEAAVVDKLTVDQGMALQKVGPEFFTTRGFYDDWDAILRNQTNDTGFVVPTRDAIYGLPVNGTNGLIRSNTVGGPSGWAALPRPPPPAPRHCPPPTTHNEHP